MVHVTVQELVNKSACTYAQICSTSTARALSCDACSAELIVMFQEAAVCPRH